jgi:hypothetical protein
VFVDWNFFRYSPDLFGKTDNLVTVGSHIAPITILKHHNPEVLFAWLQNIPLPEQESIPPSR